MKKCGLLGERLSHSYSLAIHAELAEYEYLLYEKRPEEVEAFIRNGEWDGLNVTIPYKKTVLPFCDSLSETAAKIGSVNTLVRCEDGSIFGDNTDAYGFQKLLERCQVNPKGKKAVILGSGGASVMAHAVLRSHGARDIVTISRTGENNYENLNRHSDADILINTTPVGMYPHNGKSAVEISEFDQLSAVIDVIYNPARTEILMDAEQMEIPCANGLYMLVAQAKRSAEQFAGICIADSEIDRIEKKLASQMQNIILIGMPGSGKSTVSALLSALTGKKLVEADAEIEADANMSIQEIFQKEGETGFRNRENRILNEIGKQSGLVISTGGGCVTRLDNYPALHQNGTIVYLTRSVESLAREGRPLSIGADLQAMFRKRDPLYQAFADLTITNEGTPKQTAEKILTALR